MAAFVKWYSKNFINNGSYQKIVWLGVNGYLIINEPDKQILLVDPWPSYSESPVKTSDKITELTDWLVSTTEEGYELVGIIATHEHFDHIADIPAIVKNLHDKGISIHIYCDTGSYKRIENMYTGIFGQDLAPPNNVLKYKPIGSDLYYDDITQEKKEQQKLSLSRIPDDIGETLFEDCQNYPLVAGTLLPSFEIGHYKITPYIWDHASTANQADALDDVKSGNYQRCTAFQLERKNDPEGKKLFVIGSAGEMNDKYTGGFVKDVDIEVDMLIQAVPHKIFLPTTHKKKLNAMVEYQARNIMVREVIMTNHFEDFVRRNYFFKQIYVNNQFGQLEKSDNKNRIENYAIRIIPSIMPHYLPDKKPITAVYYMNRLLIEFSFKVVKEEGDGYRTYNTFLGNNPADQIFYIPFFNVMSLNIGRNDKYLLFKDKLIGNPETKIFHQLNTAGSFLYQGLPVFIPNVLCQLSTMDFDKLTHFKHLGEAASKGYGPCRYCVRLI